MQDDGGGDEGQAADQLLLYRGVSGKLPDSFFVPDVQGMIAAVDTGFMSTSSSRDTPIHCIKGGLGVLFVLHCSEGPDQATGALHVGASLVGEASQYPGEEETLFPPLCLLEVMRERVDNGSVAGGSNGGNSNSGGFMIYERSEVKVGSGEKVLIKEIHGTPSFV